MSRISFVPYFRAERGLVIIRVIVDRKIAKVISTGIKIKKEQWNEKERIIVKHPNQKLLNQKIQKKVNELEAEVTKAELLDLSLTSQRVKKIAEGRKVTTGFYEHCEPWIYEKYRNEGTRDAMLSDLNKLKTFAPHLQFGDIDARFLTRYHNYMVHDLGNKGNTPWKSLKFIRTMLYDAGELAPHNPFKERTFRMPRYQATHKEGLYLKECDMIERLLDREDVPMMIKIVAAKFLFMCYSGLRISDFQSFDKDKHIVDGERIVMLTKKEGVKINNKLFLRLRRVMARMDELPEKKLSDQKLNEWLKVLGATARIDRIELTNHIGRHSYGCILAEMDIPIDIAQKMLGHRDRRSTEWYYKIRQHKLDDAADRLNGM